MSQRGDLTGMMLNPTQVIIGQHTLYTGNEPSVTLSVAEMKRHEDHALRASWDNDIMLLRLAAPAPRKYPPVRLANSPVNFTDSPLTVMGWGQTGYSERASRVQLEVDVDFVPFSQCLGSYGALSVTDSMMCAAREGADSCKGDSGGPLVMRGGATDGSDLQIGIVSFGVGCAHVKYPGVYTDVRQLHPWITEKLADWGIRIPCA